MARVQISIPDDLLEKADIFAKDNFISRSGLISVSLNQYLMQKDVTKSINELSSIMRLIADKGTIDEKGKKALEDIELLLKCFPK